MMIFRDYNDDLIYDILIIGGGLSGLAASVELSLYKNNKILNILLLEKSNELGYNSQFNTDGAQVISLNVSESIIQSYVNKLVGMNYPDPTCLIHTDDGLLSAGRLSRTDERPQGWNRVTGQWEHYTLTNGDISVLQNRLLEVINTNNNNNNNNNFTILTGCHVQGLKKIPKQPQQPRQEGKEKEEEEEEKNGFLWEACVLHSLSHGEQSSNQVIKKWIRSKNVIVAVPAPEALRLVKSIDIFNDSFGGDVNCNKMDYLQIHSEIIPILQSISESYIVRYSTAIRLNGLVAKIVYARFEEQYCSQTAGIHSGRYNSNYDDNSSNNKTGGGDIDNSSYYTYARELDVSSSRPAPIKNINRDESLHITLLSLPFGVINPKYKEMNSNNYKDKDHSIDTSTGKKNNNIGFFAYLLGDRIGNNTNDTVEDDSNEEGFHLDIVVHARISSPSSMSPSKTHGSSSFSSSNSSNIYLNQEETSIEIDKTCLCEWFSIWTQVPIDVIETSIEFIADIKNRYDNSNKHYEKYEKRWRCRKQAPYKASPLAPLRETGYLPISYSITPTITAAVSTTTATSLLLCGDWAEGSATASGALISGTKAAKYLLNELNSIEILENVGKKV